MSENPVSAYKPEVEIFTSGCGLVMLTIGDGSAKANLFLELREAQELAAAIGHVADLSAAGVQILVTVAITA
jgi:hypothetical protein